MGVVVGVRPFGDVVSTALLDQNLPSRPSRGHPLPGRPLRPNHALRPLRPRVALWAGVALWTLRPGSTRGPRGSC